MSVVVFCPVCFCMHFARATDCILAASRHNMYPLLCQANTRHHLRLVQCWPTVYDGGLTLNQPWVNVSCLLGDCFFPDSTADIDHPGVLFFIVERYRASQQTNACVIQRLGWLYYRLHPLNMSIQLPRDVSCIGRCSAGELFLTITSISPLVRYICSWRFRIQWV